MSEFWVFKDLRTFNNLMLFFLGLKHKKHMDEHLWSSRIPPATKKRLGTYLKLLFLIIGTSKY